MWFLRALPCVAMRVCPMRDRVFGHRLVDIQPPRLEVSHQLRLGAACGKTGPGQGLEFVIGKKTRRISHPVNEL